MYLLPLMNHLFVTYLIYIGGSSKYSELNLKMGVAMGEKRVFLEYKSISVKRNQLINYVHQYIYCK